MRQETESSGGGMHPMMGINGVTVGNQIPVVGLHLLIGNSGAGIQIPIMVSYTMIVCNFWGTRVGRWEKLQILCLRMVHAQTVLDDVLKQ